MCGESDKFNSDKTILFKILFQLHRSVIRMLLKLFLLIHGVSYSLSFKKVQNFGFNRKIRHAVYLSYLSDELAPIPSSKLLTPEFPFQISSIFNKLTDCVTDWGLLSNGDVSNFHGPEWLTFFDISKFPFLNSISPDLNSFILNLPIYQRLLLGLASLEVVPLLIDIAIISASIQNMNTFSISNISDWENIEINSTLRGIIDQLNSRCKVFNKSEISLFYSQYPRLVFKRLFDIIYIAQPFLYALFVESLLPSNEFKGVKEAETSAHLLINTITQLGPTFVFITQYLASMHPDILNEVYLSEMVTSKKQTQPLDSVVAVKIIEKALSIKVDDVFCNTKEAFREPVTSTSLGQVYRAQLKRNNEYVAVKVQRPHVKLIVTLDLYILRLFLDFAIQNLPKFSKAYDVCKALDTVLESSPLFDELNNDTVVPQVQLDTIEMHALGNKVAIYREYSNDNVLVSKWVQSLS